MDRKQALALFGGLPSRNIRELYESANPMSARQLGQGLYLGRNGGMPEPFKWIARRVAQRDWFAKLVLDGFGINVRCHQDGTHRLRRSTAIDGGVDVDLPFRLTDEGLHYGWHVMGMDLGTLQFRDTLRQIEFARILEVVPEEELARIGARPGEPCEQGDLVVGYVTPLGLDPLAGLPFGMVRDHDPTPAEIESAQAYVRRRRVLDTSPGRPTAV